AKNPHANAYSHAGQGFTLIWDSGISGHLEDVVPLAALAGEELGRFFVADDLLRLGIPLDGPAEPRGDRRQVAGAHRLHVAEDVGDREASFADAAEEVLLVPFVGLSLVEAHDVFVGVLVLVPVLFDRLPLDGAAADEDASLVAFEQDAVIAAAGDDHL